MNDENITFLCYLLSYTKKIIIDDLFRFSLALSVLENDDEYRTFQDYPIYDPSYGPKFPAGRKSENKLNYRRFFCQQQK